MDGKRNIEQTMKRLASALLIAFGALCLHADDKTTTAAPATTQPPADSPLRAAKASHTKTPSKTKKKIVITNETLAKSGGHITTSNAQPPLPPAPKVDSNVVEERQRQLGAQQAAADKARQAVEDKKKRDEAERANAMLEGDDPEGVYEDPARSEGRAEKKSPPPPSQPPTIQVQKPPM